MTEIAQVVNVTVNVGDVRVTAQGFGTPLIFATIDDAVFSDRVRSYTSIDGVAEDFDTEDKIYKAALALLSQDRAPTLIKIGRRDPQDASDNAALDAIIAVDDDWYCLLTTFKTKAILTGIAAYINAKKKIFLCSSEDADVLTTATDDVASVIKGAAYNRTAYMWHHQSGIDHTGLSYSVLDGVVTVQQNATPIRDGDPIVVFNATGESSDGVDGSYTVDSVAANGNSFTFLAPDSANNPGPSTLSYFGRYTFPEMAWAGGQLSSDPGSETWKFKQLTGVTPAPATLLTAAQETRALGKRANLYTPLGGVGHTHEGIMGSGRYIDIQRGIDWLEVKIAEAVANLLLNAAKIPYTDAGGAMLEAVIAQVLDLGIRQGLLGPLLDGSGKFYKITIPKVADQLSADRAARYFPGITVQAQLAGAVHKLAITVNAQV